MKPFIIAEAGVNHNGDLNLAFELIRQAKACGADAVKFQTYITEKLAGQATPKVPYQTQDTPEHQESHFEMLKKLELSYEDTIKVKACCDELGIEFMSTPYDPESVSFLADIGSKRLKVASADLVDFQIQRAVRLTGLPVIQSMGMSTLEEIEHWNLGYTQHDSAYPRTLLQCTSNYPSDPFNANLLAMINVGKQLKVDIGFSDHTPDHRCAVCAVAMGAKVVEKHFTLDKQLPGPDHKASSDVHEFKAYVQYIQDTVAICGKSEKRVAAEESDMRNISRKGVFTQKNLSKGETVLESDVLFRRPGTQMDMRTFQSMEGKVLNKDVPANTALSPSDFD